MENVQQPLASKPCVSVVIPVKNGERYLGAAIQSVLDQDYAPLEVLVLDGQSDDRTAQIAESFARVRYVLQHGDLGIAAARNVGIGVATGELIAFISHDDLWAGNKLTLQVEYMLAHPELEYTNTRVKFFLEPGCTVPSGFRQELLERDYEAFMPETLLARKSLFDKIGGFDPQFVIGEDIDWFVRAKEKHVPSEMMPQALTYKRVHDANLGFGPVSAELFRRDMLRIARRSIDRQRGNGLPGGREA